MEAQSHQQSHNNAHQDPKSNASPPHRAFDSHRSGFPILGSSEAMAEKEYPEAMMCFLDKMKKHANANIDSDHDSLIFESQEDQDDVELHLQLNIESAFCSNLAAADDQHQALDLNLHPLVHNTEPLLSKLWEPKPSIMALGEAGSIHSDCHEGLVEETEDKGLDLELRIGVSVGRP